MPDVNEQHMRSMGMDPSLLGAPVIPGVTWDKGMDYASDRCGSFYGNKQCARVIGHEGTHARGQVKWHYGDPSEEPEPPSRDDLVRAVFGLLGDHVSLLPEPLFELSEQIVDMLDTLKTGAP